MMYISVGKQVGYGSYSTQINKTSVLFVSISFIVLMIISLAWLVFYYIQRFRYAHAKERLSKRLMHAAKKAISKMPVRTIKSGDREIEYDFDQCAVCIESYKVSDVIRILPCKHTFHKCCVDPWLIEQRSCPMCKLDILKAYGLQIHGSRDSIINIEVEGPSTSLGPFDILSPDNGREFDNNGVEVIRFQPAEIDYHGIPVSSCADDNDDDNNDAASVAPSINHNAPSSELEHSATDASATEEVIIQEPGAMAMAAMQHETEELGNKAVESSSLLCVPSPSIESLTSDSTECELLVPKQTEQADQLTEES